MEFLSSQESWSLGCHNCHSPLRLDTQCIWGSVAIYPYCCCLLIFLFLSVKYHSIVATGNCSPFEVDFPRRNSLRGSECASRKRHWPSTSSYATGVQHMAEYSIFSPQHARKVHCSAELYRVSTPEEIWKIREAASLGNMISACLAITGCSKVPENSGRVHALNWSITRILLTVLPWTLYRIWSIWYYFTWHLKANSFHSW